MVATAGTAADKGPAARLGLSAGQVVQEFGWDEDVDQEIRDAVEAAVGSELVDEEQDEVADAVLLWFRDDDGDLVDTIVDVLTNLTEGGQVVLLTPKSGRPGHVEPGDVEEAALTSGLHATSTVSAGRDWSATRLVPPRGARR